MKRLLGYFNCEHLPPDLQRTSKLFFDLVCVLYETTDDPYRDEFIKGLEKLLEAKDLFVRNKL